MVQYGVNRDFANLAVDLFAVGTLKVPGSSAAGIPIGQIVDSTSQTLTPSTTKMVYASGGTYIGSALYSTLGVNTGSTYQITTDGNGDVSEIRVIFASIINSGVAAQTIIFDAATLNAAFGLTTVTGNITVTTVAGDFTTPLDANGNFTAPDNEAFAVYGSAMGNANYDLKVELEANQPGDFVVIQNLGAHTFVPILARKIYVTDMATTATNLLALR